MTENGISDPHEASLEQFKSDNDIYQTQLQVILNEYSQLLDEHKKLKIEREELSSIVTSQSTFNGFRRSTKAAGDAPRKPYALLLVDGNGYIFNDELIKVKEEGGMKAARMLNEAVEKYLGEYNITFTRIVVRIYADFTELSKHLGRSKLTGMEKRSIASFCAGFTRAINHFDFVDALDEEGTKFKIREAFKVAVEDSSCSHILYAACHDAGYLAQLMPYTGLRTKITLIQGAMFNQDFHQFGLDVHHFPTIFRWSELPSVALNKASASKDSSAPTQKTKGFPRRTNSTAHSAFDGDSLLGNHELSSPIDQADTDGWGSSVEQRNEKSAPCKYFSKGSCRYGNKCSFLHVDPNPVPSAPTVVSAKLPIQDLDGFIALNASKQRIDDCITNPTTEEWTIYNNRFRRQRLCNSYHLQGTCTSYNCPFDHSPLEPEVRRCLEYVVKCLPCPKKGRCRVDNCHFGHHCQKDGCKGQTKGCRMKADMHGVDIKVTDTVPAEKEAMVREDTSNGGTVEGGWGQPWY